MIQRCFFLIAVIATTFFSQTVWGANPPRFVVFTGSYNNAKWVERHIRSMAMQTYPHWECVYVNDASSDGTGALAQKYIEQYGVAHKVTLVNNLIRRGLVANINTHIRAIDERKIVVILDGDDLFAHPRVLEKLAKVYAYTDVWMTYGNYVPYPAKREHKSVSKPLPDWVIRQNAFRSYRWCTSHLRTFYAKLFHRIQEDDLKENGSFFQVAGDVAIMMPMLEMSSKGHIKFIPDILMLYNTENPASDYHRMLEVERVSNLILSRPLYTPIKDNLFP